jgi:gliding motility-associated-like protein
MISQCRIEIFNRHSQIIFRTDNWNSEFWDGTIRGRRLPVDVYYWKAYIKWSDGSFSELNGTITLLR